MTGVGGDCDYDVGDKDVDKYDCGGGGDHDESTDCGDNDDDGSAYLCC